MLINGPQIAANRDGGSRLKSLGGSESVCCRDHPKGDDLWREGLLPCSNGNQQRRYRNAVTKRSCFRRNNNSYLSPPPHPPSCNEIERDTHTHAHTRSLGNCINRLAILVTSSDYRGGGERERPCGDPRGVTLYPAPSVTVSVPVTSYRATRTWHMFAFPHKCAGQ